jgi:hypothetical protein
LPNDFESSFSFIGEATFTRETASGAVIGEAEAMPKEA